MAPGVSAQKPTTRSPHGPLAIPCENCHTNTSWRPIRAIPEFNHDSTRYPLRGLHQKVSCTQCHIKSVFTDVGHNCADCHADLHRGKMGADCERCHSVRGWQVSAQAIREHQNRFPLLGAHAAVECEACHKSAAVGQFQGLSTACSSCHLQEFQQTNNPSHLALNYPTTCESCHLMDNWVSAKFDHLKFTGYALSGAHATVPCIACHVGNRFAGTPTDCASCHLKDFNATTNPNHVRGGFPTTCASCHTTTAWSPATFDHSKTVFPLTGAHVTVTCNACHIGGNFNNTPTDCASCHLKDYNATTSPNHSQLGFPTPCATCHTTTAWSPSTFDHSKTAFPLTGFHVTVACNLCHVGGNFTTVATDCYSCHKPDFTGTTNPNHPAAGFPTDCTLCHSTTSWAGATFDHSKTLFPLTGAHVSVACSTCHVNNVYAGLATTCVTCHLKDYNGTTSPNHGASGFPQTCDLCHTTAAWQPATFDHNKTMFPLTGAHLAVPCSNCHLNANYKATPTDCYSCHKADYLGATNPNHIGAGFATACQTCHDTRSWLKAAFNHAWFVVPHHAAQCYDCHISSASYVVFSCTGNCHAQAATASKHREILGFVYTPISCYICHKGGG